MSAATDCVNVSRFGRVVVPSIAIQFGHFTGTPRLLKVTDIATTIDRDLAQMGISVAKYGFYDREARYEYSSLHDGG